MAEYVDGVAADFRRMARREIAGVSPLYERLTLAAAERPEILEIMLAAPEKLRQTHLLMAVVHYLLLRDGDGGTLLAGFYPNLAGKGVVTGDPGAAFSAFCRKNEADLRELVATRRVQTNEVRRASSILLALGQLGWDGPLSLVELGCSAGLNLFPDRYRYRFGDGAEVGEPGSPVLLSVDSRAKRKPPVPSNLPRIERRIGVDRSPIDLSSDDDIDWLMACIWPEHEERRRWLAAARGYVRIEKLDLRRGGIEEAEEALLEVAERGLAVPVTSHTVTYFSTEERRRLAEMVGGVGSEHDLDWVILEGPRVIADVTGLAKRPRFEVD